MLLSAGLASALMPRLGAKILMGTGGLVAAIGQLLLTRIGVDTAFATHVLPAEIILGFGLGLIFVPLGSVALIGVSPHDSGAASAVVNATQQVGGSLGTALLNTIATSTATAYVADHARPGVPPDQLTRLSATVAGFSIGFLWGAVMLVLAGVVVFVWVRGGRMEASPVVHM